jgi:rhodanese-related sulfurtransferase
MGGQGLSDRDRRARDRCVTAPQLTPREVAAGLASGELVAIDVREMEEWQAGHIDGAVWIPLSQLAARAAELPAGRRLAMVCRSGSRSGYAADAFHAEGVDAVNMSGGMQAWVAAGLRMSPEDGMVL